MGAQSKRIGDQLRAMLAEVVKALILEIDANLREATPVDTGHARANWVPSIGTPYRGEDDGQAQAAALGSIIAYKLTDGSAYVANNVPYINALNYGHSTQAPRMFVEDCVDRAVATIQQRYAGRIDLSGMNELRAAIGLSRGMLAFH